MFILNICPIPAAFAGHGPQKLHSHYKLHHAVFLEGVWTKSAQLGRLLQLGSPCCLCNKEFKRTHSCNVLTQVALLWLNGLDTIDRGRQALICTVCLQSFDQISALPHLRDSHNMPGTWEWCCLPTLWGHVSNRWPSSAHHECQMPVTKGPQKRWTRILHSACAISLKTQQWT